MLKELPSAMHKGFFPTGTMNKQEQPVYLFEMNTYFLTHVDTPADTVYKVTRAILDNNADFVTYHKAAATWTADFAVQDFAVPFHEGAIRYYMEKGLWGVEQQARQAALLKK
jgi:hypothetical protein